MATGYIKQSTYVDGNVITASLFNEDFGALQNAFAYTTDPSTTGHTHDGSASQGGAISKIGDADFHNKIEIDGSSNTIKFFIEVGGTTATETLKLDAGALAPVVASVDLGTSSQPFDTAFINSITLPDSNGTTNRINLGASTDFNIHYNADNTAVLQSTTASSVIEVDGKTGVKLKTDGTERLATTSTGVTVSGAFAVDTNTLVVDDTNNRVGIGAATPDSKLDVNGTVSIGGDGSSINFTGTSGSNFISAKQGLTVDIDSDFNQGATDFTITHDGRTKYLFNVDELGDISFFEDTGTSAKLFWDASEESLGIGTTTPQRELEVAGAGNVYARITASTDNDSTALELKNTQETWQIRNTDTNDDALEFIDDTATRLTIKKDGKVGIGTTDPSHTLQVNGNVRIGNASTNNENIYLSYFDETSHPTLGDIFEDSSRSAFGGLIEAGNSGQLVVGIRNNDNSDGFSVVTGGPNPEWSDDEVYDHEVFSVRSNKVVGINTPSTIGATLHVHQQDTTGTNKPVFRASSHGGGGFQIVCSDVAVANPVWNLNTFFEEELAFGDGTNEHMRIDSSGRVGIGTDNPSRPLHINHSIPGIRLDDSDGTSYGEIIYNEGSNGLLIRSDENNADSGSNIIFEVDGSESARIDSSGNLGIGTDNPTSPLDIRGSVNGNLDLAIYNQFDDDDEVAPNPSTRLYLSAASNNGYLEAHGAPENSAGLHKVDLGSTAVSSFLTFSPASTERMRIDSSGNVGIGTDNPDADLHINNTAGSELRIDTTGGSNVDSVLNFRENGVDRASLYWDGADNDLYLETTTGDIALLPTGNVGIGIDDPQNKLDVTDTMSVTGTSALLKIDSSASRAVTISADGAGTTPIDSSLTIKANRGIRLQNYNSTDSTYRDVLNINETGTGSFALETSSNFYYKERTNLAETVDDNPIVAVGDTDSLFVYDTTKDFDGGQWRLNCLNNSIAVGTKPLPKHMILAADGLLIKIIDPVGKETPYIYGYISISDVASGNIEHIEAKNGYILVFCSAPGVTGNVVLIDLINNNLIKYSPTGVLEYYDSNNVHTIQVTTGGKRYKVKTGYGTMSSIYNAFLSFPKKDGFDFESNRPRVRVNLCGSNNALLSYVNKDEYTTYVVTNGTVLGGVHNEENDSIIFYTNSTYTELVDSYTSGFTAYLTSSSSRDARIILSERRNNNSSLFGRHGDNELISKMSENGRALIMTDGDNSDSLTQIIPLKSLTQRDLQNTRPSHLFSKITETKTSGIVPSAHTGFTLFSEIQSSFTPTTISTFTSSGPLSYRSKDVILTLMPNESSEVVAEVKDEYAENIGDASVPLQRYRAVGNSPSDIGAYGLPDEITDSGDEQNIVKIDNESSFVVDDNKGFYLSFWVKFAGSHTSAPNEDLIKIGLDDGKQFKIALDSNSLPAFYTKSSGTTYSSASLDTPSNSNAPSLTDWVNVTLVKPLKFSGFTQLFVNGVEVDSSVDIDKSVYGINASGTTVQVVCGHKYVLSLVKHYVPISSHDGITTEIVEKIYDLEKPMFTPVAGIKYLTAPSNSSDDNFVTFNKHTKKLKVINTAKTIEYEGLVGTDVDSSDGRLQPTTGVSSGAYILAGE